MHNEGTELAGSVLSLCQRTFTSIAHNYTLNSMTINVTTQIKRHIYT